MYQLEINESFLRIGGNEARRNFVSDLKLRDVSNQFSFYWRVLDAHPGSFFGSTGYEAMKGLTDSRAQGNGSSALLDEALYLVGVVLFFSATPGEGLQIFD